MYVARTSSLDPVYAVRKVIAMWGWRYMWMCYGSFVVYASARIARMVPRERRLVFTI